MRVGVGEGARARGLKSGVVAMCSSARVGVGEGAEACSSTNFGRPGQLNGIWPGLWVSASGVLRKAPLCSSRRVIPDLT